MRVLDVIPRITERSLQAARQAGSLVVSVACSVAEPIVGRRRDEAAGRMRDGQPAPSRPRHPPATTPAPAPVAPIPLADPAPPADEIAPTKPVPRPEPVSLPAPAPRPEPLPPPEPVHVDRDAVVVAESADRGAADGAGAQVHVAEPWHGYGALKARDVADHLATADTALLAVVRLYESTHRTRRTVLSEVDRLLATGG